MAMAAAGIVASVTVQDGALDGGLVGRGRDAAAGQLGGRLEQFAAGLAAYRREQWLAAKAAFEQVLALTPDDRPSQIYVERCRVRLAGLPEAFVPG